MTGTSLPPRRRRPVRYFSGTATGVPQLFLPQPPAPTAWANAGQRLSNHWARGPRTRMVPGGPSTASPQPASPKPPPRPSRRSFRGRDGKRFRKPRPRGCRFEQLSGNWESTEPLPRNTWTPRGLRRGNPGPVPPRHRLIPWQPNRVTFMLNT